MTLESPSRTTIDELFEFFIRNDYEKYSFEKRQYPYINRSYWFMEPAGILYDYNQDPSQDFREQVARYHDDFLEYFPEYEKLFL